MRIVAIFWLAACVCQSEELWAQAAALNTVVSISFRNAGMEAALQGLSERSGVPLSFSAEMLPAKRVTGKFLQQPLSAVLDFVLDGTGLTYRELGGQIVIYRQPQALERRHTISGFMQDAASGEPLIGAYIRDKHSGKLAVSNEYGFFSLTLPTGEVGLRFSYIGYDAEDFALELHRDTTLRVRLRSNAMLSEVVVSAKEHSAKSQGNRSIPIEPSNIEIMPALGGEPDVVRALHLLPGVQTGTDGFEGLHVRGGSQGHNLVLIDGVPVYNYSHAAGIFSVFNTAAVRSMRFYKGGFPARYGGRLAAVLDVRTKEGNTQQWQGQADFSALSGRFTLEGPLARGKSAVFLSGRASLINLYLKPISQAFKREQNERGQILYQFDDLNVKWHHAFSAKDKLYLSLYTGRDQFTNEGFRSRHFSIFEPAFSDTLRVRYDQTYHDAFDWGNIIGSLRWNHLIGNKLFVNTTATYSRFQVNIRYEDADSIILLKPLALLGRSINVGQYNSSIEERGLRTDIDYVPTPSHYVRIGAAGALRRFQPGAIVYNERNEGNINQANAPLAAGEFSLYAEDEWRLDSRWRLHYGLHWAYWWVEGRGYQSAQPRLQVHWQANRTLDIRAAYSRMAQFLHLLNNSDLGLPTDLWVPSTGDINPEQSNQYELGMEWRFAPGFSLEVEAYHKQMRHLLAFTEGAAVLNDWRQNVTPGEGEAYGLEYLLQYRNERTMAWVSYALAYATRHFERVNLGREFPFKYDRRHDLKVATAYRLKPWCWLSANWILSSGFAYSLPLTEFTFQIPGQPSPPVVVPDFGAKNRYRMPWYHRLDLSAYFHWRSRRLGHSIQLGVYNAYNRLNPLYYNIRTQLENENGRIVISRQFVQVQLLPLMPSLGYSLRF